MKKRIMLTAFGMAFGVTSMAVAGFIGPDKAAITVAQALTLRDDTPVVLTGTIQQSLGDEKYLFSDASGQITIDIDTDDWHGLTVTPADTVVIYGEIDKDFFRKEIQVDVDRIVLKK